MKKISVLQIVLVSAILAIAQTSEVRGLKLQGSGACISSCVDPIHTLETNSRIFEVNWPLSRSQLACAINQVGEKCLERMKEERRKHKSFLATRTGWKMQEQYTEADYIYCRLGGMYRTKAEFCIYSHPPIRPKKR